jgi:hypothetical protein
LNIGRLAFVRLKFSSYIISFFSRIRLLQMKLPEELRQRILSSSAESSFYNRLSSTPVVDPSHDYVQPASSVDYACRQSDSSYRMTKSNYLPVHNWSNYAGDVRDDDDDEDTNSDREMMMSRQSSNLLTVSGAPATYDSGRSYLCGSAQLMDRMCASIGSSSGPFGGGVRLTAGFPPQCDTSPNSFAAGNFSSLRPMYEDELSGVGDITDIALHQSYPEEDDET